MSDKNDNKVIHAFKGFNRDMTCRGFKYEVGQEYETARAEVCEEGFHACEYPIDCFGYYAPGKSVYHEVEMGGDIDNSGGDTKLAATHIKIGARLDIAGLCRAAFEFVRSHCTNEHNAEPGEPATAGGSGAATAGDYGAATAGESGAATAGDYGAATAGGSVSVGANGIGCVRGDGVKAKGGLGAILVIAEENACDFDIKFSATIVIDGETYKPDTWYRLDVNGNVVEVEENEDER